MNMIETICGLLSYSLDEELIDDEDVMYCANRLSSLLHVPFPADFQFAYIPDSDMHALLNEMLDDAIEKGIIRDSQYEKDIFDTKIMDVVTPRPSSVQLAFSTDCMYRPELATDHFHHIQKACNYIRTDRIAKDRRWKYDSPYGTMEITINLSKPELDPKSIAAMKQSEKTGYPCNLLCHQNVGFEGNAAHPSRLTLRQIVITLDDERWLMQYSPYAYFDEHCIVLTENIRPMKIDEHAFRSMFAFVSRFPHYLLGSNSDLPICGGSILSHEHFQGGRHIFAMNRAPIRTPVVFTGFEDIKAGIVHWPMSVIRLQGYSTDWLTELAVKILNAWQCYDNDALMIHSHNETQLLSTITPIVHKENGMYVMELILRNSLVTEEYPLGYFHSHPENHHIKKENIGLIEAMGLAILPARLKKEMQEVRTRILNHKNLAESPLSAPHAAWAKEWMNHYEDISKENIDAIIEKEIGNAFVHVLKDCAVFPDTEEGQNAFLSFLKSI